MTRVVAVVGPTASGKTTMAIELAKALNGQVVSVDSMQVYRGMDIGTAKPNLIERQGVPHHMIDLVDPSEEFTVSEFRRVGKQVIGGIDGPAIIVGGSGLHFRALVDPMRFAPTEETLRAGLEEMPDADLIDELLSSDPSAGDHVDLANRRRVVRAVEVLRLTGETPSTRAGSAEAEDVKRYVAELEFVGIGVDPGEEIDDRIGRRLSAMRSGGLVEEVSGLRGRMGRTARNAVGYREILRLLEGALGEDEAFASIEANTRKLARRQRTWFQRDPRIRWIPWIEDDEARVARAMEILG